MKQKIFVVFLLVLLSSIAFSQTKEKDSKIEQEITVCKIKFTKIGGTAHHQFSYRYAIKSDKNGKVKDITTLHKDLPKLVNEEDFIPCIKSWKFNPSSRIFVQIFYGTTSAKFSIFIFDIDKRETIRIPLPLNENLSQVNDTSDLKKEITLCSIKLKNKAGNFYLSYRYVAETNEKGNLIKVDQLGKQTYQNFFNYEDFAPCIENWKLKPNENYSISFNLGTKEYDQQKNFVEISSKSENIKIYLGNISKEIIPEEVEN